MIELKIDSEALRAALERLARGTANPAPVMRVIAGILHDSVMEAFAQEGRPKWLGLKPATLRDKAKRGYGNRILVRRGGGQSLISSISQQSDRTSAVVGTAIKYGAIHQFGGSIQRAAYSKQIRHRTDAQGNLLTTKAFAGKGLVFAQDRHKRALTRWAEVGAHQIHIPARPYLQLTDGDQATIVRRVTAYLRTLSG